MVELWFGFKTPMFAIAPLKLHLSVDLYIAIFIISPSMRSGMDHKVLPANYIIPACTS